VRQLRDYGQSERDVFARPGHNNRLDEIQAAILRLKLRHLPEWNERRRILAARYTAAFEDLARVTPPRERPAATPVYHLYVVRSPGRDELRQALTAAGLPTLIHYPTPIHRQPAYAGLGWPAGSLPVTEQCAREILSLPLFPFLKDEEQEQVVTAVRRWAQT
jgi:dTDP-3-amino-3,4,6-trideoxy-alpha-D-glucose transaminase